MQSPMPTTLGRSFEQPLTTNDIECIPWLNEINMGQYSTTFLVNLSGDGRILSRSRLNQMRQKDLASMNITNFQHQKLIMDHIHHVLQYSYHSPVRKKDLKAKLSAKYPDVPKTIIVPAKPEDQKKGASNQSFSNEIMKEKPKEQKTKTISATRRKSFGK